MSGELTQAQREWLHDVLGIDADADPAIAEAGASTRASPGAIGKQAPAAAGSGAEEQASGGPGGGQQTGSVKTPLGDFVFLAAAKAKVEGALETIVTGFEAIRSEDENLSALLTRLEDLQEKYNNTNPSDIRDEINAKSDRTLKDEAGAARGSDVVNKGFKNFLDDLSTRMDEAQQGLKLTQDDFAVQGMHDQAAELTRIGKEVQEGPFKGLLEGINKVKSVAGQVSGLIAEPEDPLAWLEMADTLFDLFQGPNTFLTQAAALEKQANTLHLTTLEGKVKLARATLANLKKEIDKWQPIVAKAGQDQKTKVGTRDHYYDSKKGGTFRFGDAKEGMTSCKEAHDLALRMVGEAHQVADRIRALFKANGDDHSTWMAKPADGSKILNGMEQEARALYRRYEPKVAWSAALGKAFEKLYADAGDALADAPDK